MKGQMKIRKSTGERVVDGLIYAFMVLLTFSMLAPFWDILMESINRGYAAGFNRFWPSKPTFDNYIYVFKSAKIWLGYKNTLIVTVAGTLCSLAGTMIGAYALSKRQFPFRKFFTLMIVIPMFFGGGLIAGYLWNVQLGLRNTYLCMFLPGMISSYNLVVMRNFFSGIPNELEESAYIDGANNIQILFRIYIPLSTAVIATVALWEMVGYWNSWFSASIYITKANMKPLQIVLRDIINQGSLEVDDNSRIGNNLQGNMDNLKSATLYVCMLPIMCVYPFLQKYFMKGTLVGSIKG